MRNSLACTCSLLLATILSSAARAESYTDVTRWMDVGDGLLGAGESIESMIPGPGAVVGFEVRFDYDEPTPDASWASDAQLMVTNPDGQSYTIGGLSNLPSADIKWSFQGPPSNDPGRYGDSGDDVNLPWKASPQSAGLFGVRLTNDWLGDPNPNAYGDFQIRFYRRLEGACCLPDVSCIFVTEEACAANEGDFVGDLIPCSATNCRDLGVACCFDDGVCVNLSPSNCEAAGGVADRDRATCASVTCPAPPGACCFVDGTCVELELEECTKSEGRFAGDGTTCRATDCQFPLGACCFNDMACQNRNEGDCTSAGGTYQGAFTPCGPKICPPIVGACCLGDGSCTVFTVLECNLALGVYQGPATSCRTVMCPKIIGACCFPKDVCLDLLPSVCARTEGAFLGGLTDCLVNSCVPANCRADVSGDGIVGLDDILIILTDWGACPGCPTDLDGDGIVGLGDLLIVLSEWGLCVG